MAFVRFTGFSLLAEAMEQQISSAGILICKALRQCWSPRAWRLGDKAFKTELLAQMHQQRGDHYGPELREADMVHGEGLLQAELRRRRWAANLRR